MGTKSIRVMEIRVLDPNKKSKFIVRRTSNLPIVSTLDKFRENILCFSPDLESVAVSNFQVGYVAEQNKKFSVRSAEELEKGYGNGVCG